MRQLALLFICLGVLAEAQADIRYVTDQCSVPLRKGGGLKFKITRMLRSGAVLDVTGDDNGSGYTPVRTPDGTDGFVATSELAAEPPARDRLTAMETKLAELQQAPETLATKLAALQAEHENLKSVHERVTRERGRLEQDLAALRSASADIVEITNDRAELRRRVAELTRQGADLEQENRELTLQTNQRWFLIGAGILAVGLLLGLILPNLRMRRRKNSWSSL